MELRKESYEIEYGGKKEEFVVQEMTFNVRTTIQQKYSKYVEHEGMLVPVTDIAKMHLFKAEMVKESLVKAPFEIKTEVILKQPAAVVDRIFELANRINTVDEGKKFPVAGVGEEQPAEDKKQD